MKTFLLFLLVASTSFAVSETPLDLSKPLTCVDEAGYPIVQVTAPDQQQVRSLRFTGIHRHYGVIKFNFCVDSSAADSAFGVSGGTLTCFDKRYAPGYRFEVVASTGFDGEKGKMRFSDATRMKDLILGTCTEAN